MKCKVQRCNNEATEWYVSDTAIQVCSDCKEEMISLEKTKQYPKQSLIVKIFNWLKTKNG